MKKLLKVLSILTISTPISLTTVACNDFDHQSEPKPEPESEPITAKGLPSNEDKINWTFVSDPSTIEVGDDNVYLLIVKDNDGNYQNFDLKKAADLQFEIKYYNPKNQWFYCWNGHNKCAGALVNAENGEIANWKTINYPKLIFEGDNKLYLLIYHNKQHYNTVKIKNNSEINPFLNRTNEEALQIMIKSGSIKSLYCWSKDETPKSAVYYPTPQIDDNTGEIIY